MSEAKKRPFSGMKEQVVLLFVLVTATAVVYVHAAYFGL
jgi:hypothetical protein